MKIKKVINNGWKNVEKMQKILEDCYQIDGKQSENCRKMSELDGNCRKMSEMLEKL